MYKVNYTFKEDEHTQMGSFEVENCSFNDKEFFTLIDYYEGPSISIMHLEEPPEVYGKTIYLKVKDVDFPCLPSDIEWEVHVYGCQDDKEAAVKRYKKAFNLLNDFRDGLNYV
jgi:hypothetical protein